MVLAQESCSLTNNSSDTIAQNCQKNRSSVELVTEQLAVNLDGHGILSVMMRQK